MLRSGADSCPAPSDPLADFCFTLSDDISTRNLIGRPDYQVLTTDAYTVSHPGMTLEFLKRFKRDLQLKIGQDGGSYTFSHPEAVGP